MNRGEELNIKEILFDTAVILGQYKLEDYEAELHKKPHIEKLKEMTLGNLSVIAEDRNLYNNFINAMVRIRKNAGSFHFNLEEVIAGIDTAYRIYLKAKNKYL